MIFGLGTEFTCARLPGTDFHVLSRSRYLLFPLLALFLAETSDASRDAYLKDYPIMLFLRPHYSLRQGCYCAFIVIVKQDNILAFLR